MDIPIGDQGGNLDVEIAEAEAALDSLREGANNLLDEITLRRSPALSERLRIADKQIELEEQRLIELKEQRETLSSAFIQQRVKTLLRAVQERQGVETVNVCLRMVFEAVVIDRAGGTLVFKWKQGGPPILVPYSWPKATA